VSDLLEVLGHLEAAGAALKLDGDKVRIVFPEEQRKHLADHFTFLRAHRDDVVAWLKARATVPAMPPGVQLLHWQLKEPPVAVEVCAVVTDPALFARTTLEQLGIAISEPKRWVGWTVPQLVDRLNQIGVGVKVEPEGAAA
jgi:hypothetical protein